MYTIYNYLGIYVISRTCVYDMCRRYEGAVYHVCTRMNVFVSRHVYVYDSLYRTCIYYVASTVSIEINVKLVSFPAT